MLSPMKVEDLDNLISKLEDEGRRLQAELAAAKAFRPVLVKHEHGTTAATAPVLAQPPLIRTEENGDGYGAVMRNIRTAISRCPAHYSIYDVESALTQMGAPMQRDHISQALSRLARKNEIYLHKRGAGRVPSVYRKEVVAS